MRKYKNKSKVAHFKATNTPKIVKFEAAPLSAEFTEDNGVVYTSGLILVEGEHTDSKQRKHVFSADRVQRIVDNTNKLLQQGARLPLLTDHQKTQDTTIGDVEGLIEARVITAEDIKDSRYSHLVGRFGAFVNNVAIKARKAVEQYKDKLISTVSPGIDIVSDTIREVSCTSTPAIVGLRLFKSYDNEATFALSFDELEQNDGMIDQIKTQYDTLTEQLWVILTSVLTADDDDIQQSGQDQSQLLENALDDFENRLLDVLGVQEDDEEDSNETTPQTTQQEDQQAQQVGSQMPRTISQRMGTKPPANYNTPDYSDAPQIVAAFTLADMEKLSEYGIGSNIFNAAKKVATAAGSQVGNIKRKGLLTAAAEGAGSTSGAIKGGFAGAKKIAQASGKGRLRSNLSGAAGAVRQGLSTTGGKIAAAGVGTAAVGATALGVNKLRKPRKPKF